MEYEYGYIYGGFFVVGYCHFIHEYCQKNQVDKVLFLSRDGDILSQVYDMLYPEENTEYVYWSRKAATKLMESSDRYDYFRRFLDHKVNHQITIKDIFKSMELEHMLSDLPEKDMEKAYLTSENVKLVKKFLLEHWDDVLASYEWEHYVAKVY